MRGSDSTPASNAPATRKRNAYTSREWPCVFNGDLVREQVDPRIKEQWAEKRDDKPKFGDLRNTFRREHCRTLNPYGSSTCPFAERDCVIAFYRAVQQAIGARNAHGYFIKVCRSTGAARADIAVELRAERARMRTDVTHERADARPVGGPVPDRLRERSPAGVAPQPDRPDVGDAGTVGSMAPAPGESVRSPFARPGSVGAVLGSLDLRPRPMPDDDEQEGPRR